MEIAYPTLQEPATPEYVLAVFADWLRQELAFGWVEEEIELTFETTLQAWLATNVDVRCNWWDLGRGWNETWRMRATKQEWRAVLCPLHERTLGDVCCFIAQRAQRQRPRPVQMFGRTCLSAGAFLTIRSLLHEAGADVCRLMPSTPLDSYAYRYLGVFMGPVARLAPQALPDVNVIQHRKAQFGCLMCMLGLLCCGAGWLTQVQTLYWSGATILVENTLLFLYAHKYLTRAEFGELRTFRDLAKAIEQRLLAESC
jgi:hypothetical protein